MSLSSWDTLAFNTEGEACNGVLVVGNASVEIYKNWLYVRNKEMWKEKEGQFTNNVIAEINHGHVELSRFDIIAKRHDEQNSIFVCATSGYGEDKKVLVGIGCYGFLDTARIYVEKMGLDPNKEWMGGSSHHDGITEEVVSCFTEGGVEDHIVPKDIVISYENAWVGVSETTYKAFIEFLIDMEEGGMIDKEYLDKIKKAEALRFNQGDAFFSKALIQDIPATEIEQSEQPIFSKIISSLNK